MAKYQGATPTYTLTFRDENLDFRQASEICITFAMRNGKKLFELGNESLVIDEKTIGFDLTQEQTLSLPEQEVYFQVNWTYQDGGKKKRAMSERVPEFYLRNLKNEVM